MLRDPALVPLSHQHQHSLALCMRLQRTPLGTAGQVIAAQEDIARLYDNEIRFHFEAEERVLFPAAAGHQHLRQLVDDLRRDHVGLRASIRAAADATMTPSDLREFASRLADHIRREERALFETMQTLFPRNELSRLGEAVNAVFRAAGIPG